MTTDTRYNGWTNSETWTIALWFGNDGGIYNTTQKEYPEQAIKEASDRNEAVGILARMLEEFVSEQNPLSNDSSFFSDLLTSAIDAVD